MRLAPGTLKWRHLADAHLRVIRSHLTLHSRVRSKVRGQRLKWKLGVCYASMGVDCWSGVECMCLGVHAGVACEGTVLTEGERGEGSTTLSAPGTKQGKEVGALIFIFIYSTRKMPTIALACYSDYPLPDNVGHT